MTDADRAHPETVTSAGPSVLRIIGLLDPEYGGTSEASVSETVAAQRSGVMNTFVFGIDATSRVTTRETQERLRRAGVIVKPFRVLPIARFYSRRWGLSVSLCCWILLHARRYDVVHLHQTWGLPQLAGLAAAVLFRRPCVITPHECLTTYDVAREKRLVKQRLKDTFLRHASLTIFASELEAADSVGDVDRQRTTVLPHPIPDAPAVVGSAHHPDSNTNPFTVGFLGRLHPKKNLELVIDAIGELDGAIHLRVAGDGPKAYKASLVDRARRAGIADRVEWLGFVDRADHAEFFSNVDALAMVSDYECFGLAASEAMAHSVAVVVSDRTGIAPIVRQYGCGLVVAADVRQIADALRELSGDRGRLAELATQGPSAVRDKLSMQAYGSRVRRSYDELTARGATRIRS